MKNFMSPGFFILKKLYQNIKDAFWIFCQSLSFFWFCVRTLTACIQGPFYRSIFLNQWKMMAFQSIPLMALTALFTGMVLALQSASAFASFSTEATLPHIVTLAIVRELAPVLGGLMMAGRWGSSMTAEVSTMRVTDQIDALVTLSTNPLGYLVVPRILSATLAMPCLILLADVVGIVGGGIVATSHCSMLWSQYIVKILDVLVWSDVGAGMIKACAFGLTISLIGCYQGYYATGGTQGVGLSTTRSVVQSSTYILLLNYFLTSLLFQ
jgi:phospholipid/cholesterol/gamma-HCH transport system permease protein